MKSEELKNALRLITKVQTDPRLGSDCGDRLLKTKRELERIARSGKVEREKLFHVIEMIAVVLRETVEK